MDKSRALIDMNKGELFKYIMELEDEIEQLKDENKGYREDLQKYGRKIEQLEDDIKDRYHQWEQIEKEKDEIIDELEEKSNEIEELEEMIRIYDIQIWAAMKAKSLGLCKKCLSHAIRDIKALEDKD